MSASRWIRLPVLAVLLAAACMGGDESPVGPTTSLPASLDGFIWGFVVKDSGVCIDGAVVRILEGPGAGRSSRQPGPCDAWSYGGGFEFSDLPMGAHLKLEATAEGYQAQKLDVVVGNGGPPVQFDLEPN